MDGEGPPSRGSEGSVELQLPQGTRAGQLSRPELEEYWQHSLCSQEIYESPAGVEDHWGQAQKSWDDFGKMVEVIGSCNPQTLHAGSIAQSLW
jgi:hypothetical protein